MGRERKVLKKLTENKRYTRDKDKLIENLVDIFDRRVQQNGIKDTTFRQIIDESGKARSVVYKYLRNKDGLIMCLVNSEKYAVLSDIDLERKLNDHRENNGEELYQILLHQHFNEMQSSRFVRELNLMKLTDSSALMDDIINKKEDYRKKLFTLGKEYFKHKNIDFIAVMAILLAGLCFIIQFSKNNKTTFHGFDINNKQHMDHLLQTAKQLIRMVYKYAKEK